MLEGLTLERLRTQINGYRLNGCLPDAKVECSTPSTTVGTSVPDNRLASAEHAWRAGHDR